MFALNQHCKSWKVNNFNKEQWTARGAGGAARGFWAAGQIAFFDIRVFYRPNATRYVNQRLQQCYASNENEKKRKHTNPVMNVEQRCFVLVFSANGGMGREGKKFYSVLAEMITLKRKQ